ncbi:MAG: GSU2403 family nucleotidyltransferase fold protein [Coriobacteriia bacterium]
MSNEFEIGLAELLRVLAPYRDDFVLVGGWVPQLYARYLRLSDHASLYTRDVDLAVEPKLKMREYAVDQLLKSAGLTDRHKALRTPPIVCYVGQLKGCEVELEFLTIERGDREGPRMVQSGLYAVGLHYIDLLLGRPFEICVDLSGQSTQVRVPSPASFVIQKCLTFRQRREQERRAKDLYYIFDVWDSCREWRDWILTEAAELRISRGSWMKRAVANLDQPFAEPDGEGIRMLVTQRPATAFTEMSDERFAQYAWGEMLTLREALRGA